MCEIMIFLPWDEMQRTSHNDYVLLILKYSSLTANSKYV